MKKLISSFITVALLLSIPLVFSTSAYSQDPHEFILKWGSQGSGDGQFQRPIGIGADSSGNVFVADPWNHRIQKFTPEGVLIVCLQMIRTHP